MGDTDCCGLEDTSSPLDNKWTKAEKAIKEWNEQKMKAFKASCCMADTSTASSEVKKNNWVHGICNPKACDYKDGKDSWEY